MNETQSPFLDKSAAWLPRRRTLRAIAVSVLLVAVVATVVLVGPRALNRVRGAASPEDVATSYIAAARRGDALRIRWLMPTEQESLLPIAERIERYREVSGQTLAVTYEPHSVAAYLMTARITGDRVADEIRMQAFGARWYLVQLP